MTPRAMHIHITLLLTFLLSSAAEARATTIQAASASSSSLSPPPSPFLSLFPSPPASASLVHAVVVHGWSGESSDEPSIGCSLSVAAWTPDTREDGEASDVDAARGGGEWRIEQRWRMHEPTLLLTLLPPTHRAHTPSLLPASSNAFTLPKLQVAEPRLSSSPSSRWLLQLRCATAAGQRIPVLPARGIPVDAVMRQLEHARARLIAIVEQLPCLLGPFQLTQRAFVCIHRLLLLSLLLSLCLFQDGEAVSHFVLQMPSAASSYLFGLRRHLRTPSWLLRLKRGVANRLQLARLRLLQWPPIRQLHWALNAVSGHATDALSGLLRFIAPVAFWRAVEDQLRHAVQLWRDLLESAWPPESADSVWSPSGVLATIATLALLHLLLALYLLHRQQHAEAALHPRRPPLRSLAEMKEPKEQRDAQSVDHMQEPPPMQVERPWQALSQSAQPQLPPAFEQKEGRSAGTEEHKGDSPPLSSAAAPSSGATAVHRPRPASPLEQLGSAVAEAEQAAVVAAAALVRTSMRPSSRPSRRPLRHITSQSPPPTRRSRRSGGGSECSVQ